MIGRIRNELAEPPPIEHTVVLAELPVVFFDRAEQGEEALSKLWRTDCLGALHRVEFDAETPKFLQTEERGAIDVGVVFAGEHRVVADGVEQRRLVTGRLGESWARSTVDLRYVGIASVPVGGDEEAVS